MRVLITGISGFVGNKLREECEKKGWDVRGLSRSQVEGKEEVDSLFLQKLDVLVHLAGEPIQGLWTKQKKEKIYISRIVYTEKVLDFLRKQNSFPHSILSASALGYYGDQKEREVRKEEEQAFYPGFLPLVCRKWEQMLFSYPFSYQPRLIALRFGMVLSPLGGLMGLWLGLARYKLLSVLGSGLQWMSWISLEDACRAIIHLIKENSITGAVHIATAHPIEQRRFIKRLASFTKSKHYYTIPSLLLYLGGEQVRELGCASIKAYPYKLECSSFPFLHPYLQDLII